MLLIYLNLFQLCDFQIIQANIFIICYIYYFTILNSDNFGKFSKFFNPTPFIVR